MKDEASWEAHRSLKQAERRLAFFRQLQELTDRIHSADDIQDIMMGRSRDICTLFGCDRLTLYAVSPGKTHIESRIKTGMDSFKDFVLPISNSSIAGHVALTKRSFNIANVYDEEELRSHSRDLRFLDKVDKRTGYRTREMITAPVLNVRTGELLGVLQLINNRLGGPFPALIEEGAQALCKSLAIAFEQRMKPSLAIHTRFDPLVLLGSLSIAELELAKRSARRKQADLEDVLIDDFQVRLEDLGAAYAHFFGVPYESLRDVRSMSKLQQGLKREYVEHNGWLILEEDDGVLTVLALDPVRLKATHVVRDLFPGHQIRYRVSTRREFVQTVDQLYGRGAAPQATAARGPSDAMLARIHQVITDALATQLPELQATLRPEYSELTGAEDSSRRQLVLRINLG